MGEKLLEFSVPLITLSKDNSYSVNSNRYRVCPILILSDKLRKRKIHFLCSSGDF